jgi:hypothetical protein
MEKDRAAEGLGHLQTAALELIAAARAFLDVSEELVRDPGTADAISAAISSLANAARTAAARAGTAPERERSDHVERIRVS